MPPLGSALDWNHRASATPSSSAARVTSPVTTPTPTPTPVPAPRIETELVLDAEVPRSGVSNKTPRIDDADLELLIPTLASLRPPSTEEPLPALAPSPVAVRDEVPEAAVVVEAVVEAEGPTVEPPSIPRPASAAPKREPMRARRRAMLFAAGAAVLAVAAVAAKLSAASSAIAASAPSAERFVASGFRALPASVWNAERVEENVAAGSCVVAVGASATAPIPIEVTRNGVAIAATGSVGFCTCTNETVVVSARGGSGARSVRLLRTEASAFGGVLGFANAPARPAAVEPCACTEEHADAWLDSATRDRSPGVAGALPTAFAGSGLEVSGSAPASIPLVPIDVAAKTCTVVVSANDSDTLSLRAHGGARVIAAGRGAIAACGTSARTLSVWHEGDGALTMLRGDATRVGGRRGLRAIAAQSGRTLRAWTDASDLPWDADLALTSASTSTVESKPWVAAVRTPVEARVIALGFDAPLAGSGFVPPAGGTCEGDPNAGVLLCVQSGVRSWTKPPGVANAALAIAPVPFWLKVLATPLAPGAGSRDAAVLSMMGLASRMRAAGFDLSVLESVTETSAGAVVLGRAGEDAIVAVTLQSKMPHLLPLSPDLAPWTVEGPPRVVPIQPGQRVTLRAPVAPFGVASARRTIVFRRPIK